MAFAELMTCIVLEIYDEICSLIVDDFERGKNVFLMLKNVLIKIRCLVNF